MQVKNIALLRELPFDKYLEIPGMSYSTIKSFDTGPFQATPKMQLGTLVHNYLLEPAKYDFFNPNHKEVQLMASIIKNKLGMAMPGLEPEVAVFADFEHEGFVMPYKGRIDLLRYGRLIIDLKVSSVPLSKSIPFFGYDKQISGYALCTDSKAQIILRICPKSYETELKTITTNADWWQTQVVKFGAPIGTEFSTN